MWNRLLIFLGLRIDYMDPDNAAPGFDGIQPHPFEPHASLPCCRQCGGGRKHPIHA